MIADNQPRYRGLEITGRQERQADDNRQAESEIDAEADHIERLDKLAPQTARRRPCRPRGGSDRCRTKPCRRRRAGPGSPNRAGCCVRRARRKTPTGRAAPGRNRHSAASSWRGQRAPNSSQPGRWLRNCSRLSRTATATNAPMAKSANARYAPQVSVVIQSSNGTTPLRLASSRSPIDTAARSDQPGLAAELERDDEGGQRQIAEPFGRQRPADIVEGQNDR